MVNMLSAAEINKILLVGEWRWPWYQEACARALKSAGAEVVPFAYGDRMSAASPDWGWLRRYGNKLEWRLTAGPTIIAINCDLLRAAVEAKPQIIWLYNAHPIMRSTVARIRQILPGTVICQYANDDPFSPLARSGLWRHYRKIIPLSDLQFCYRSANLDEVRRSGGKNVSLLRSYFIPEEDYPEPLESIEEHLRSDVVFAGHFEEDGRVAMLEVLCRAGLDVKIFGTGWDQALPKLSPESPLRCLFPIRRVVGTEYRKALSGAKVALCFLSKINRDQYTRRNFQIPAVGTPMLSEYSDELAGLFVPGDEAMYFRNAMELVQASKLLVTDPRSRAKISTAALRRVWDDGHDVYSRMRQWLSVVEGYIEQRKYGRIASGN